MPQDSPKTKARLLEILDEVEKRIDDVYMSASSLDKLFDRLSPGGVFPTLRKELKK